MDQHDSDIGNTLLDLVDSLDINDTSPPQSHNNGSRPDSQRESPSSPATANASGGFCVKEHQSKLDRLVKENFNLKLRLYFLEEKNPNIPQGAESLYKENIDLRLEVDALQKDLNDKLDLLYLANAAIHEQENANKSELERANNKIAELNQKIAEMTSEIFALDAQLLESKESNSHGNDTGFTEFMGAVDGTKDRSKAEWKQKESQLKTQIQQLDHDKEILSAKIVSMKDAYEFLDKKFKRIELGMKDEKKKIEAELNKFKDLWGTTQCDLQDAEEKVKEKEIEAKKAFMLVKSTMTDLKLEREKVKILENKITDLDSSNGHKSSKENIKNFTKKTLEDYRQKLKEFEERCTEYEKKMEDKVNEAQVNKKKLEQVIRNQESDITQLRIELSDCKKQLKSQTTQDLKERNRAVSDLSHLMKNISGRHSSIAPRHSRISALSAVAEKAAESFNDLEFQQAMLQKKITQEKMNELIKQLSQTTNIPTKEHIKELEDQLKILVEKQEITDAALERYTDICSLTFSHLSELAQFLAMLIKKEHIRSTLEDSTICQIQNVLDKTIEFSHRMSMDNRMSMENISMLEVLMDSTRMSIANIKEIKTLNVSMQTSEDEIVGNLKKVKEELANLNGVNQVLEDEIVLLKQTLSTNNEVIESLKIDASQKDEQITSFKQIVANKDEEIAESQNKFSSIQSALDEKVYCAQALIAELELQLTGLETKLQEETVKRIQAFDEAAKNKKNAAISKDKLEKLEADINANWVPKVNHDNEVKQLQEELMSQEAQIAAIKMDLDAKISVIEDLQLNKENERPRRTLEISEDRMRLILGNSSVGNVIKTEEPSSTSATKANSEESFNSATSENQSESMEVDLCPQCPVLREKVKGYKKYLEKAIAKLKTFESMKKVQDRLIEGQVDKTNSFLKNVSSHMKSLAEETKAKK